MKGLFTKNIIVGFSTIELLIAFALLSVIMVGAVGSIMSAQYWFITAQISNEAINKSKIIIGNIQAVGTENFQQVSTITSEVSKDEGLLSDKSCIDGGQCYFVDKTVTDISSCAKEVTVSVSWKISERYPSSSVTTRSYLSNNNEILSAGGDCLVEALHNDWGEVLPQLGGQIILPPQQITGVDVLGEYMYVTSMQSPFLRIFKLSDNPDHAPVLVSSSSVQGIRINDIDVIRDYLTGRMYAYLMQHSSTSQLIVYDVTDSTSPEFLAEYPLLNVASAGSFPQGWRVVAYGNQLFVVTRETTGPELHIFSIMDPRLPLEITTAPINLNRTVNDMVIRDEIVNGLKRRFLYLAASSDLKEVGVYDVTDTVPVEIAAINLNGNADAVSIYLNGSILYVGRRNSTTPELYAFNSQKLIANELQVLATGEVGGEVLALTSTGRELVVGTGKNGSEFQIWNNDLQTWNSLVVNAGQLSSFSSPRIAPLGIDIGMNNMFVVSQSQTLSENISVLYTP
ncbi:hypothetical protein K2P47_00600 [Patescibacteria group bacterium]|nr:hypothetical protein [Patescibacteria group bacterium]